MKKINKSKFQRVERSDGWWEVTHYNNHHQPEEKRLLKEFEYIVNPTTSLVYTTDGMIFEYRKDEGQYFERKDLFLNY